MKKWMQYMEANYLKEGLMTRDKYGDWCVPPESKELIHSRDPLRKTDGVLLASAYYIHLLKLMTKFAGIVNADQKDIRHYEELAGKMTGAFNNRFFHKGKNSYDNNTVTANLLPLAFGITPVGLREKVFENIEYTIEKTNKGHISTGVIGTQFLMRTLTEYGRADLALRLASNTTYPSWGYMVENGATTIWELWNGNTANPKMNSQNHVMLLGDLLIWYYEDLAGIKSDPEAPGFKRIIMKPAFPDGLEHVNASYRSVHGLIKSQWKKKGNGLQWKVTIPPNTTAEVYLPANSTGKIKLNNEKPDRTETSFREKNNRIVLQLGSGDHTIRIN